MVKSKNIEPVLDTGRKSKKKFQLQNGKTWLYHLYTILMNPKKYFSSIVADGSYEAPMIKAFVYGLVGGLVVLLMQLLGGAAITMGVVFAKLVITPILAVVVLFLLSGLIMLMTEITGGDMDYEIALKGLGSVFFVYPVMLALNQLGSYCWSLWIVSLVVDAYVLFLLYNIVVYCMKGKKVNTQIVIVTMAVFMLTIYMTTDNRMAWFLLKNTSGALACMMA